MSKVIINLLEELKELADISNEHFKNGMLVDSRFQAVADIKDVINNEEDVRFTIFRIKYKGYKILPF